MPGFDYYFAAWIDKSGKDRWDMLTDKELDNVLADRKNTDFTIIDKENSAIMDKEAFLNFEDQ